MKKLATLILLLVILVGAFFLFKPKSKSVPAKSTKSFTLIVKDKKLASGSETLNVDQGDEVVIKITADSDEELHLHGYDKSVELVKDQPAELKFKADLTGNFPYELEHSKTDIGSLQVQPKP